MVEILFAIMMVTALVIIANWLETKSNPGWALLFDMGLGVLQLPVLLLGLVLMVLPDDQAAFLRGNGLALPDFAGAGAAIMGMGLWGLVVVIRPLRRQLARVLPLRPDSPVHALALLLCGYLVGNTLLTLTQGGLESLAETAVAATISDVILQQALFAILALFGVGFLVRRGGSDLQTRLGLASLRTISVRTVLIWVAVLVVVQGAIGALWQMMDPEQAEVLGGLNEALLADFDTLGEWFTLAAAAGIGEELLFRGALQPVFGLGFTSVLFAIAHVQYGLTPITLVVVLLGFALGIIRQRHDTTTAILVHFGYNFTLGVFSLIAANFVT